MMDNISSSEDDGPLTLEQAEARLRAARPLLEKARQIKRNVESIAAGYNYDAVLIEQ
jgi:hypothetical protein